jgi:hypothetical protein
MTPGMTVLGRAAGNMERGSNKLRIREVIYTTDDGQLLGLLTAMRFLGEIREKVEPMDQTEVLIQAQILLTAFVVGLQPIISDQTGPAILGAGPSQIRTFDA